MDKINEWIKEYKIKYPEKRKAVDLANKHMLLKEKCDICGERNVRLERHHWRYDKPLLVNTLCKFCHDVQHRSVI